MTYVIALIIILLVRLVNGSRDLHQFFNQKKQNQNHLHLDNTQFPDAFSKFHVTARNSNWFIALFAPVVIGQSNYFGIGFSTAI